MYCTCNMDGILNEQKKMYGSKKNPFCIIQWFGKNWLINTVSLPLFENNVFVALLNWLTNHW